MRIGDSPSPAVRPSSALPASAAAVPSTPARPVDTFEAAPIAATAVASPRNSDTQYDGAVVGAKTPQHPDGVYPAGSSPLDVTAITPNNGKPATETVVFVNGIGTTKDGELGDMQALANNGKLPTGLNVIGIHNATDGFAGDILQSGADKIDRGDNKAVVAVRDLIVKELSQGHDLHLVGHSQGGLVIARAIKDAVPELQSQLHLTRDQAVQLLGKLKVEDFGSAASNYQDGPKYVHYINDQDPVPMNFGLGGRLPDTRDGAGGKLHYISGTPFNLFDPSTWNRFRNHDLGMYIDHREDFDAAYANNNRV
jgi:hypothetical protein